MRNAYPFRVAYLFLVVKVTVASNRMLGMIGAILMVVSCAGSVVTLADNVVSATGIIQGIVLGISGGVFGLSGFVGIILFLISMFGLSRDYHEHNIFNNILYGAIAFIATAAVVGAIMGIMILSLSIPSANPNPISTVAAVADTSLTSDLVAVSQPIIGGVAAVAFVMFFMRSLKLLAEKTSVPFFELTSKAVLAVAAIIAAVNVLCAILVLGTSFSLTNFTVATSLIALLQYVIWGMLAVSFFRIIPKDPEPAPTITTAAPAPPQLKYCHRCGAANQMTSQYCIKCGQKLATIEG